MLKEDFGLIYPYIELPNFYDTYFGSIKDLDTASNAFFERCLDSNDPLFQDGWMGWPRDANQDDVLRWLAGFTDKLAAFAKSYNSTRPHQRRRMLWDRPNEPLQDSTADRKMDVGFIKDTNVGQNSRFH